MSETDVKRSLLEYLHARGYYAVPVQSGKVCVKNGKYTSWIQLAPEGTPDVFACIRGRFVGIEVKKDEKTLKAWERQFERFRQTSIFVKSSEHSIKQHLEHQKILDAGGDVITTFSIEDLANDIDELEYNQVRDYAHLE